MEKCEVRDNDIPVLNEESKQNWVSIKDFIPADFSTFDIKGDNFGKYLCLVERPYIKNELSLGRRNEHPDMISRSCELCYWNTLSKRFQDMNNEWVKVTHWCQVSKLPRHNIQVIDRQKMLLNLSDKIYELIKHQNQSKYIDIEGMWEVIKENELHSVSFDEIVYLSIEIDVNGLEDYMWCIEIKKV